jgi:hypothetical protein
MNTDRRRGTRWIARNDPRKLVIERMAFKKDEAPPA